MVGPTHRLPTLGELATLLVIVLFQRLVVVLIHVDEHFVERLHLLLILLWVRQPLVEVGEHRRKRLTDFVTILVNGVHHGIHHITQLHRIVGIYAVHLSCVHLHHLGGQRLHLAGVGHNLCAVGQLLHHLVVAIRHQTQLHQFVAEVALCLLHKLILQQHLVNLLLHGSLSALDVQLVLGGVLQHGLRERTGIQVIDRLRAIELLQTTGGFGHVDSLHGIECPL